ncbi:MAG: fasciclin domain-containing protein [Burkholderiales bacterium]
MQFLKLLFTGALALSLVACHLDDDPKPAPTKNIVETATAAGGFTTLLAAAGAADPAVVATLTGAGPVTLFAPTDDAFTALLAELGVTANQLLADKALLTTVLTYHVVPGKVLKADIPLGKAITSAEANKSIFKVDTNAAGALQVFDGRNRASTITKTDILAKNGVIHVIDKVLLPANKNIVQTAQGSADFSILVEAVVAADLATALSGAGPFTVFAPTNAAFAAALTELGVTKDALLANKPLLTKILTYHVVTSRVLKADIPFGTPVATLQGETLTIDTTATITDQNARKSKIILTDVLTTNGVIHAIDKVILPKQ